MPIIFTGLRNKAHLGLFKITGSLSCPCFHPLDFGSSPPLPFRCLPVRPASWRCGEAGGQRSRGSQGPAWGLVGGAEGTPAGASGVWGFFARAAGRPPQSLALPALTPCFMMGP